MGRGVFTEAKQPISQNRSVWKHDEFSYSLLKGLFRTEDCGGEDAAEDLFLTHTYTQLGRGSWKGRKDYYCPLLFATGITYSWWSLGLLSRGSPQLNIWRGRNVWVQFPHIGIMIAASVKMWVFKMLNENGWDVHIFPLHTPALCISQSGEPTQTQARGRNQWRYTRLGSHIQKISALTGYSLTFSPRLCKNREAFSDSSSWNKTSNYSYPV